MRIIRGQRGRQKNTSGSRNKKRNDHVNFVHQYGKKSCNREERSWRFTNTVYRG